MAIVYVKINENNYITSINSDEFLLDTTGWIEIDRGYGDKYCHAQGNYFENPLYTLNDAYNYKLIDGKPVKCSEEEILEQERLIQNLIDSIPSQSDLIEAQVMYTAMMTDTLLA